MASEAELKWGAVIARADNFRSISRDGDTMFLEIRHAFSGLISTRETPVQEFYLPRMKYIFGARASTQVTLVFRRYRLGVTLPDEYRIKMKWSPVWFPAEFGKALAIFYPHPDRVYLLFPVLESGSLQSHNQIPPRTLSLREVSDRNDRLLPHRLVQHIVGQVPRSIRSNVSRVSKQPPFSIEGKQPQVNKTIIRNNEDGGEQFNQPYAFTLQPYTAYSRVINSVRTPGFRSLHKSQLPVNPFSCTIRKVDNRQGLLRRDHPNPDGWVVRTAPSLGGFFANVPLNAIHNVQAYNSAQARLVKQMDADVSSNIALNLLQVDQTARLIATSANRIRRSVAALKRFDFPNAVDQLFAGRSIRRSQYGKIRKGVPSRDRSLAENWLELQYGWKPLLSDIDGAIRLIAQTAISRPPVRMARSSAGVQNVDRSSIFLQEVTSPGYSGLQPAEETSFSSCRLMVKYGLTDEHQAFLQQTGFTSPLNLVWEILPYSFVVDWFLPIGPYLETLNAFDSMNFIEGSRTRFTRAGKHCQVSLNGVKMAGNVTNTFNVHCGFSQETIQVDRDKLVSFPRPILSFKNPLSIGHALNSLALLRAVFGR